jgi:NADPH:quinone reductase-like Zn-dependent oxidoreductase
MKAARIHARGGPQEVVYEEADEPVLEAGDALVRVMASSITRDELSWPTTYETREGTPRLPSIPGHEVAGVVESVAPDVSDVKVGAEVYGLASFFRNGTAAEYVAVAAKDLAPRPMTIDFDHASTAPLAGLTAWQALFDHGKLTRGMRLLVHGGAGGVGAFAVQLGRWKGAHVIATASARHAEALRELGADEVLDHAKGRFEDVVRDVDLVLDTVGGEVFDRSRKVLGANGRLVTIVEDLSKASPEERRQAVYFVVEPNGAQLVAIGRLIDAGAIKTVVADVFPLKDARKAFATAQERHPSGKLVLRVRKVDSGLHQRAFWLSDVQ